MCAIETLGGLSPSSAHAVPVNMRRRRRLETQFIFKYIHIYACIIECVCASTFIDNVIGILLFHFIFLSSPVCPFLGYRPPFAQLNIVRYNNNIII